MISGCVEKIMQAHVFKIATDYWLNFTCACVIFAIDILKLKIQLNTSTPFNECYSTTLYYIITLYIIRVSVTYKGM